MFIVFGEALRLYEKRNQRLLKQYLTPARNADDLIDGQWLSEILKPYRNKKIFFVFAGPEVSLHSFKLPVTKAKEALNIIENQIHEFLPVQKKSHVIGVTLGDDAVIVGAIQKTTVQHYQDVAEKSGIRLKAIDIGLYYEKDRVRNRIYKEDEKFTLQYDFIQPINNKGSFFSAGFFSDGPVRLVLSVLIVVLLSGHFILKARIKQFEHSLNESRRTEAALSPLTAQRNQVYQIALAESIQAQFLLEILQDAATTMEITRFSIAGGQKEITLSGRCGDRMDIYRWAAQIESMDQIDQVGYSYVQTETSWDFIIYIYLLEEGFGL